MADIFISYSRKDSERALMLVESLRKKGLGVWIDQQGIGPATSWSGEIVTAIQNCDAFVLLLSVDSMASENVRKEAAIAGEYKRPFIPIEIEPGAPIPRDLLYHVAGVQRMTFTTAEAVAEAIRQRVALVEVRPVKSAPAVEVTTRPANKPPRIDRRTWMIALIAVVLSIAGYGSYRALHTAHTSSVLDPSAGIAVLPFASPDANYSLLFEGLARTITEHLGEAAELKVLGTTSSKLAALFPDSALLGQAHMRYALRGTGSLKDSEFYLNVALTDLRTGEEIMRRSYATLHRDLGPVAERLTEDIAAIFHLKHREFHFQHTNPEAFQIYLRAFTAENDTAKLDLLNASLRIDSDYAPAIATKANFITSLGMRSGNEQQYKRAEARTMAVRALTLDPQCAEAYQALSFLELWEGNLQQYMQAATAMFRLRPGDANVLALYGEMSTVMKDTSSRSVIKRYLEIDPLNSELWTEAAIAVARINDSATSVEYAKKAVAAYAQYALTHPDDVHRLATAISMKRMAHDTLGIRKMLADVVNRAPDVRVILYNAACDYSQLGERDKAIALVERFIKLYPAQAVFAREDVDFIPLHNDPAFRKLVGLK